MRGRIRTAMRSRMIMCHPVTATRHLIESKKVVVCDQRECT
ncbi:MAG: hypothetical protein IJV41_12785 [Oscillospiraceae bacterium]|nr:hypothetical protein [Oscillospiraceae bacterium]